MTADARAFVGTLGGIILTAILIAVMMLIFG